MIDWKKIRKEYEESDITARALAEKYGIKPSTLRSRKNREGWKRDATQSKNVASRRNATDRPGGQKGNQNAKGNSGGKAPPENKNAVSHGLFAKWLPDDTRSLIQEIYTSEPADIIWNNIMIQYAAIIRSQKIMNVTNEFDTTTDITEVDLNPKLIDENGKPAQIKEVRQYQYAWDKQANYLMAMSRAMGTLSKLIKQFVEIADEQDERRKKLEIMTVQLDFVKAKTKRAQIENGDVDQQELGDDGFLEAIDKSMDDVWKDGDKDET
ncbi:phage terminase small subunit [Liquorilactobacillus satsumensis]|uniref:phage terminase small subunit n=1 Tax=Liquorilactobacillus satsumensis TaxID=259059 RepID=UPI0039EA4F05